MSIHKPLDTATKKYSTECRGPLKPSNVLIIKEHCENDKNAIACDDIFLQTVSIPDESIDVDELVENSRTCQTKL